MAPSSSSSDALLERVLARVEELETRVTELEAENAAKDARITELEADNARLRQENTRLKRENAQLTNFWEPVIWSHRPDPRGAPP